ncbi:MAG: 30S ribosome-binding factor RbfA [Nitrospirae bacterium]|nr:30S ribosome-binding factor RbfA [Nitrospirota bacterium]
MSFKRIERIGDQIRVEVSDIIARRLHDPRVGFVTVTAVEVSEDLRHAKVFVSVFGDDRTKEETMKGLKSAAGFIKGEVGHRITLKFTPDLHFRLDESLEKAEHVLSILSELEKEENK